MIELLRIYRANPNTEHIIDSRFRYRQEPKDSHRINENIRQGRIFLIDENGQPFGETDVAKAFEMAKQGGLDLVEIGPNGIPPVCKILDYGKFKYEQEKKQQKNKTKSHAGEIKEIRFSVKTDEHDFNTKISRAKEFIEKGYKLRVTVKLTGRENIYFDRAIKQIERIAEVLSLSIEQRPARLGTRFSAMLIKSDEKPKEKPEVQKEK